MRLVLIIAALLMGMLDVAASASVAPPVESDATQWIGGAGSWNDASHWLGGVPDAFHRAEVHGAGHVVIPAGTFQAADLEVGLAAGDRSEVRLDGGALVLRQDSLRIGELTGSAGEFDLNAGAMHCVMDVFVGGASSVPGRANHAVLRIRGGSFLGRTLTVGAGLGATSVVSIEGSGPSSVHVLDYAYIQAQSDPAGAAGDATLGFTLDAHGVTPITIQSRADGLRIIRDAASHCRLQIALMAVPPRDDITLVHARVPTRGTFDDLPEGSAITATFNGQRYQWQLTYHGAAGGNDLVLQNRSSYPADAPITYCRPIPSIPVPLWGDQPLLPRHIDPGMPAFDGAEGYGAGAAGGRGGRTLYVDNLNDAGAGSLRAAVAAAGPRIAVFRVGGAVSLNSPLMIDEPFITLDGQAAPGDGITLRGNGITVRTHDVVLRNFRIRVGDDNVRERHKSLSYYQGGEGDYALYFIDGASNCIADHLSMSWSTSKMLSTTKGSDRITVQWCILSESLNFADHGFASITGGNRISWHHNLLAHHQSRNVRFQGVVDADFRNNVIYDWGDTAAYGEFDRLNYVGNYLKPGPSTTQPRRLFHNGKEVVAAGSIYVAGNILEGDAQVNQDNWRGMGYYYFDRATLAAREPFPAPPITGESAAAAYMHVLSDAGDTLPARDAVDGRIIGQVRNGTGHIINWVADLGAGPGISPVSGPARSSQ